MRRIALVLTLSTTTAVAQAQGATPNVDPATSPAPVSPEQAKAASAQAKAGKALLKQQDYVGARTLLESAYNTAPTGAVLVDLTQTYRGLSLNALALQTLLRAKATGVPTLNPAETAAVQTHIAELTEQVFRLSLRLPQGVTAIQLDGVTVEPPPSGVPLVLEPGLHSIKIEQPGYEVYTKDVNAVAGQDISLVVELDKWVDTGRVNVTDKNGQKLNVYVDGIQVGTTPWSGELPAGHHVIEAKSERSTAEQRTIDLPRRAVVDIELQSIIHYERLIVNSPVRGAQAYLDGQLIQLPYDQMVLVGEHQLRVTAPGHAPLEKTLVVEPNKPVNEQVTLSGARVDELDLEREKPPVPVRVGFLVGIVSIPRPINVELSLKPNELLGFGVGFSMIPRIEVDQFAAQMYAVNAVGRIFPFQGAFYVGLGAGVQNIDVEAYQDIRNQRYTGQVEHTSFFVTPQVGWLWTWDSGFTLGLNFGAQIPVTSTPEVTIRNAAGREVDPGRAAELRDDVSDVAEILGFYPLPAFDLLKIGFFF